MGGFGIKNFSVKFIDMMIGIVLGLGLQWWVNLESTWQYVAFVFCYFDITDYWIDYGPSLKKFPPKREIDVFLDVAIAFSLFFYIYTTQVGVFYFLISCAAIRILDFFWLWSSNVEYKPVGFDKLYVETWMKFNIIQVFMVFVIILSSYLLALSPLVTIIIYILERVALRVIASLKYKRFFYS